MARPPYNSPLPTHKTQPLYGKLRRSQDYLKRRPIRRSDLLDEGIIRGTFAEIKMILIRMPGDLLDFPWLSLVVHGIHTEI